MLTTGAAVATAVAKLAGATSAAPSEAAAAVTSLESK